MCFQLQSKIANCKSCHLKIIFRHVVCNASFGRKLQLFLLTCVPHFVLSPIEHLLSSHEDLTSNNCKLLIINFEALHFVLFFQLLDPFFKFLLLFGFLILASAKIVEFDSPPGDMPSEDKELSMNTLQGYCLCENSDLCYYFDPPGSSTSRIKLDSSKISAKSKTFYFAYGWTPY